MRTIILILKILNLWLPFVTNITEMNCTLRCEVLLDGRLSMLLRFWKDWGVFTYGIRQSTEELNSAWQREKNLELEEFLNGGWGGEMRVREEGVRIKEICGWAPEYGPFSWPSSQWNNANCKCGSFELNSASWLTWDDCLRPWSQRTSEPIIPCSLNWQTQTNKVPRSTKSWYLDHTRIFKPS